MTKTAFAISVLQALGAPVNATNVSSLLSWMNAEGGNWNNTATYNPLNTTLPMPGSTVMSGGNSAGVQAYSSWSQGLAATVRTLQDPAYSSVVGALRNSAGCSSVAGAVAASPWGTGAYSCNQSVTDSQVAQALSDPSSLDPSVPVSAQTTSFWSSLWKDVTTPGYKQVGGAASGAASGAVGSALDPIWNDFKTYATEGMFVLLGVGLVGAGILVMAQQPKDDVEQSVKPVIEEAGPLAAAAAA